MKLNEEQNRMRVLAGIKSAPLTLSEAEDKLITEGIIANIAAGLGLTLLSFTNVLAQTGNLDKLKYSQDKKETIEKAMEDPQVQEKLKELGIEDNNINKEISLLKGKKAIGFQTKTATSEKDLQKYMKMGYHLTAVDRDTVINKMKKENKVIESVQLKMNEEAMFASGKFQLSPIDSQNIKGVLDSISETESTLIGVTIISSTDKQGISPRLQALLKSLGYSPDNQGLSQARNNGVKSVLESFGVDSSIVNQNVLAEQGGETIDQNARYVVAIFDVVKDVSPNPEEKDVVEVKSIYTLIKPKIKHSGHHKRTLGLCRFKSGTYDTKRSPTDCFFEMQKNQ